MTTSVSPSRPPESEYPAPFARYIERVTETDILATLEAQADELVRFFREIPAAKIDFRYAPGKWTPRQILGHVVDTERIMAYRALAIARGETASLPGYEEDAYAAHAPHATQDLSDLLAELEHLRRANVRMLRALSPEAWARTGTANGRAISVRALAWVLAGHPRHHQAVLRERYLA